MQNIKRNAGLQETKLGIKIAGRNTNCLWYAEVSILVARRENRKESLVEGEIKDCKNLPAAVLKILPLPPTQIKSVSAQCVSAQKLKYWRMLSS